MNINWEGLKGRNIFADFVSGQEAGEEMRQTAAKRKALNLFATDPEAAEQAMIAAGDIQTAEAIRKRREAASAKTNRGLVGVVAQTKGPAAAQAKAAQVGDDELAQMYAKLDETQRKQLAEQTDAMAAILFPYQDKTPEEIARDLPVIQQQLKARGIDPTKMGVDITQPANIRGLVNEAAGVKELFAQADRDRNFQAQERQRAWQRKRPVIIPQTADVFMPEDDAEPVDVNVRMDGDVASDVLSGGGGADRLAGGSGRDIPGYRMVRAGRPPQKGGGQGPAQWVTMSEAESQQYGAGKFQKNTRTGEIRPVAGAGKEPPEGAKKTAMFSYRAIKANERMNALAQEGILQPTAWQLVTDKNGIRRFALDKMQPNDRRFLSASKEWLAPILRRDTGAAVTDDEFLFYADIFIPQPGDPPALLKQKAEARKDAMDAMVFEERDLLNKTYGPQRYNVRFAPDRKPQASGRGPKTQGKGWRIIP